MIKCKLGNKTYEIAYATARAFREADKATRTYETYIRVADKLSKGEELTKDELQLSNATIVDALAEWFVCLFQWQFTTDELIDNYPLDDFITDVIGALVQCNQNLSSALSEFPTRPTGTKTASSQKTTSK